MISLANLAVGFCDASEATLFEVGVFTCSMAWEKGPEA